MKGTLQLRPLGPPSVLLRTLALSSFLLLGTVPTAAAQEEEAASETAGSPKITEPPEAGSPEAETAPSEELPERFATWLEEVAPLISDTERRLFLTLRRDYQRDAFIQEFWKVRDPFPRTPRNELAERWPYRVAAARGLFEGLDNDRARIYLVHGKPDAEAKVVCGQKFVAAEIWAYRGTAATDVSTALIFYRLSPQHEVRLWNPDRGRFVIEQVLRRARTCINGVQLQQVVALIDGQREEYVQKLRLLLLKPRPSSREWIYSFVAHTTDLDPDDRPLHADVQFGFLGRHQHRTVVQGVLTVPLREVAVGEYAGYRSHDLQLTGEVILDDKLFERFRYKFGFGEQPAPGSLPLAFQRYLRPGKYRMILKLEDLNSDRAFRTEQLLEVPAVEERFEVPTFNDPRTQQLFAEATAAIEAGETGIRLIPPEGELHTGFLRVDSLVSGDEIEKVRFLLDDHHILTRNRPPFDVEIDLGDFPDLHTLRAEALGTDGEELATDEILINSGGYRFDVRLVEPRRGKRYDNSLRARVEVEVPEGRTLDRIELFLNERRVATLYQEPFVQPVVLPEGEEIAYVRAVAYLPDGNSTEDLVFINAPDYLEEIEVQFVELFTTVLDRQGRPVEGLEKQDFTVREDGVEQEIARFDRVENLPIHVGILIDNSASMTGTLDEVRKTALHFFEQAITPKDRAAVITFNNFPHLAVELTNDRTALGSGLAGLTAEGKTALYDSVMFSLYYFAGIKGQRAVLLLSDGKDESSRFDFDQTLEYARRAGITVYSIGLRLYDPGARNKLRRLADETGGRSFFIGDIGELDDIYTQIQQELRSQYLVAYQSNNRSEDEAFRAVDLEVDRSGVEVKTLSGYYP